MYSSAIFETKPSSKNFFLNMINLYKNKNIKSILLVGSSGYIGSNIYRELLNNNNPKYKITSIPINYKIPKISSIKIFNLNNFIYLWELIKIIIKKN
tara:strand:- start:175 stop:465 length:291 start_codon:yes stop_codon:yes gene_type:complete